MISCRKLSTASVATLVAVALFSGGCAITYEPARTRVMGYDLVSRTDTIDPVTGYKIRTFTWRYEDGKLVETEQVIRPGDVERRRGTPRPQPRFID